MTDDLGAVRPRPGSPRRNTITVVFYAQDTGLIFARPQGRFDHEIRAHRSQEVTDDFTRGSP